MKVISTIFVFVICAYFANGQAVELKYNLEKNKVYRAKISSTQAQTTSMQGVDRSVETVSNTYFSIKMLDSKPDFIIAEAQFDSIITEVSAPPMLLNSNNKGDINSPEITEVMSCVLNRLCNSKILVKMDYRGKILEIMNYPVIAENVLAGTDSLKGQVAMAAPQIKILGDKDGIKGSIEGVTYYLPNKKVKKGAQWNSDILSLAGGIGMTISSNYELKEIDGNIATLGVNNSMKPSSAEPISMGGAEITNELSGLAKGTLEVDAQSGWIIKSESKAQLSGEMHVSAGGKAFSVPVEGNITSAITAIQ